MLFDQTLDETQPAHRAGEALQPRSAARKPDGDAQVTRPSRELGSVLMHCRPIGRFRRIDLVPVLTLRLARAGLQHGLERGVVL